MAEDINDETLHQQLHNHNGKEYVLSIDYSKYVESVTSIYRNLCDIFGIDKDRSNFSFHLKDGVVINKDAHIDNYKCFKYEDSSNEILSACITAEPDYRTFLVSKILPSSTKEIKTGTFSEQS